MSWMELLRRFDRGLVALEKAILGASVLGIACSNIANVAARNLFGGSLSFTEELNQAFMVWITFAGLGLAARRARHIRMAAFYDQLRGPARKIVWTLTAAGTCVLLALLSVLAFEYVATSRVVGGVTPALRVPSWMIQSIVPVGLAVGAFEYALTVVRNLRSDGVHAAFDLDERDLDLDVPGADEGPAA